MEHPVRALRHERGLTLDQAAQQLATSKGNLSRIEQGVHGASDPLKRRIAEWSGGKITATDLVDFVPDKSSSVGNAAPTVDDSGRA